MDPFVRGLLALPPLNAEEERVLARRARQGDVKARADLITAGMRAVALRAMLCGFRGDEMRDAVQSGAVGLIRAVDQFDPDRGARLATYSWHWIGSAMKVSARPEIPLDDIDQGSIEAAVSAAPVVTDLLDGMPDELAAVIRLRFGLGSSAEPAMTRSQVAERAGLTVAQVRQREAKAMRHLRSRLARVAYRAPPRGADPL